MSFKMECPHCNRTLNVTEKAFGKTVPCPGCNQPVTVPEKPQPLSSARRREELASPTTTVHAAVVPDVPPSPSAFHEGMPASPVNPSLPARNACTSTNQTKRCQLCGEKILAIAIKCKHCGSTLQDTPPRNFPNQEIPRGVGTKISGKAIILGLAADLGGSVLASVAVGVVIAIALASRGIRVDATDADAQMALAGIPGLVISIVFAILGGFVAGRVAKRSEVLHGGIVGALDILIGLPFCGSYPSWYNVAYIIGEFSFALLGGYIAESGQRND